MMHENTKLKHSAMLQLTLPVHRVTECEIKKTTWKIAQYVCMQTCVQYVCMQACLQYVCMQTCAQYVCMQTCLQCKVRVGIVVTCAVWPLLTFRAALLTHWAAPHFWKACSTLLTHISLKSPCFIRCWPWSLNLNVSRASQFQRAC